MKEVDGWARWGMEEVMPGERELRVSREDGAPILSPSAGWDGHGGEEHTVDVNTVEVDGCRQSASSSR